MGAAPSMVPPLTIVVEAPSARSGFDKFKSSITHRFASTFERRPCGLVKLEPMRRAMCVRSQELPEAAALGEAEAH